MRANIKNIYSSIQLCSFSFDYSKKEKDHADLHCSVCWCCFDLTSMSSWNLPNSGYEYVFLPEYEPLTVKTIHTLQDSWYNKGEFRKHALQAVRVEKF